MEDLKPKIWFENQLRRTLNGLYDPGVLLNTPLPQLFDLVGRHHTASALRRLLTEAIETQRPAPTTPSDTQTWRIYQILRRRYIEQLTQQQVAVDLGLSVRQLQRIEKLARQVLTDYLWSTYNLDESVIQVMADPYGSKADPYGLGTEDANPPSMAQELEWLQDSVQAQTVSCVSILNEITDVLSPLMQDSGISTHIEVEDDLPEILVKTPFFRQATLNILNTAVLCCPQSSTVDVTISHSDNDVRMYYQTSCPLMPEVLLAPEFSESIEMAKRLIELCQGQLVCVTESESDVFVKGDIYKVIVTLPAQDSIDILVVDDNADVLQLYQRYLAGTRYRFRGAQNAQEGLEMAIDIQPAVVLLDVMMPGQDGWTLLGQLREHPKTQDIPIIVCSILSQEQFALALGAVNFLRKPVTRQAFLGVLDRQLAQPLTESG